MEKVVHDNDLLQAGIWSCNLCHANGQTIIFSVWETQGVQEAKYML